MWIFICIYLYNVRIQSSIFVLSNIYHFIIYLSGKHENALFCFTEIHSTSFLCAVPSCTTAHRIFFLPTVTQYPFPFPPLPSPFAFPTLWWGPFSLNSYETVSQNPHQNLMMQDSSSCVWLVSLSPLISVPFMLWQVTRFHLSVIR